MNKDEYIKWSMENIDHEILLEASMELVRVVLDEYTKKTLPSIFIPHEGGLQ